MSKLKELRKAAKMTQTDLGKILGVSFQTVSMWEKGKTRPRAALLPKVADALGCTVDELLRETA